MRLQRAAWGLLVFVLADAACFDSDQTFKSAATTTGTSGTTTTTTAETTTTGTTTTSAETGPFDTCRDAIQCVFQCAGSIQVLIQMGIEPDLSCFIECAETLSVDEVYKLFNLINCTGQVCKELGECVDSSTTSSGESSSSSSSSSTSGDTSTTSGSSSESSSSSSSSSEAGDEGGLIDPCINCIFTRMLDPESPGCEEFAMMCE